MIKGYKYKQGEGIFVIRDELPEQDLGHVTPRLNNNSRSRASLS